MLKYGLSVILVFIGVKMLIVDFYHIPVAISLGVVGGILAATLLINATGSTGSTTSSANCQSNLLPRRRPSLAAR